MIPSRRFLVLLGMMAPAIVLGAVVPMVLWFVLLADGVLIICALFDWKRARSVRLEASREWPRLLVQDEQATLDLVLRCSAPTRIAVRETLHSSLASLPFSLRVRSASSGVGRSTRGF